MAKQTGTFIDDARLVPRDNSGGPMGPHDGGQFGGGGKVIGGEPNMTAAEDAMSGDEFKANPPPPAGRKGGY